MKNLFLFAILLFAFLPFRSSAQVVFGVSPGLQLNGAYVGYKFNDQFMASFGFQYFGMSYKFSDSAGELEKFKGALIIPTLGLKYYMARTNQIQPYLTFILSKPILSGSLEYEGEPDPDFENALDNVNILGFGLGFGVEYFFDDNFSLGGEYGFQNMSVKIEVDEEFDEEVKASFNPTYTKLTLNYYFGGGE